MQSDGEFADILAVLDEWDGLSGAERKERSVIILGESSKSKGYKLARKYHLVRGGRGGRRSRSHEGWRKG